MIIKELIIEKVKKMRLLSKILVIIICSLFLEQGGSLKASSKTEVSGEIFVNKEDEATKTFERIINAEENQTKEEELTQLINKYLGLEGNPDMKQIRKELCSLFL